MRRLQFLHLTLRDFLWLAVVTGLALLLYLQRVEHDAEAARLNQQIQELTFEAVKLRMELLDQESFYRTGMTKGFREPSAETPESPSTVAD